MKNPGHSCEKQAVQSRKVLCRITTGLGVHVEQLEGRGVRAVGQGTDAYAKQPILDDASTWIKKEFIWCSYGVVFT